MSIKRYLPEYKSGDIPVQILIFPCRAQKPSGLTELHLPKQGKEVRVSSKAITPTKSHPLPLEYQDPKACDCSDQKQIRLKAKCTLI